jgi:hypothetical protein
MWLMSLLLSNILKSYLFQKEVPMRTENNTEFGLEESKDGKNEGPVGDGDGEVGDVILAPDRSRHSDGSGTKSRAFDVIPLEEVTGSPQ